MQNDLISRSALKKDLLDRSFFPAIVKTALEKAPAVDAVEVVRCKDCKWALPNEASNDWVNCGNCFETAQRKDWYCADGERRGEDG